MRARSRELLLLLAACTMCTAIGINGTSTERAPDLYQYDYDGADDPEPEAVLFNENKPCPRDCICTVSQGYRIAKCNRLELGTQKFGDDITDLVIENADARRPIKLVDYIFRDLGLHQISTVKIVNTTIASVGPKAFHGLHELYAVNLSNNKLKSLHPETFANNRKLLLLTLANNPLKFPAKGSNEYFLNASTVQELDVSNCDMQYITVNTFRYMPTLMYLNLAGNNIFDMDPDTFKTLLDLEELDLSDNNIKSLRDDIFSENTELATLHIQRNPIDTVYGLKISDLLTLNAGQTNIKFIGPSMFNGMTYIANLNLSGNGIEKIHNQAFHKLIELNYLDLSYNNLDYMSNVLIKENIELDIFKISNNPNLKRLPEEGFECTMDQFNIYLFDASYCGLTELSDNVLSTFTALTQINLAGNQIKTVSDRVFSRSPKLVEINLANNLLTSLDNKVFAQNKELGKLNIRGNPLKALSVELFIPTPSLTWLDISHAELTHLWAEDRDYPHKLLNNLNFLNISYNRINEIKESEVQSFHKLRTFDIAYNPLVCNREFENLLTWLSKHDVMPTGNRASIANLAKDAKDEETNYSWDSLSRKTCDTAKLPIQTSSSPVSDEEIWERIDKDSEGNFDLKDTLDDGKVADENELFIKNNKAEKDEDNDMSEEDLENEDEDGDDGDDEDDNSVEDYNTIDKNKPTLNIKLEETSSISPKDDVQIKIKLLDEDEHMYKEIDQDIYMKASLGESEQSRYGYVWPIVIALLCTIVLLLAIGKIMIVWCGRRNRQVHYNSAIIAAMSQPGRTKKDCGLVYQQLSEDLTGPTTPKLNRYAPLHTVTVNATNMSYESSPFHHNNIVPEAV
ncbi:Insulin-like growth factor-binding protein complex acid labile subunit [Eumeta japonica]|uniref:Insulin-like growth factor-binding protein complex acid labile subunit n=1 Tax=Eumeta variegata TaxID=151549 RepID=A0A4C1THU2_EUMVA|nr:Insulin-like growth factor-binding protein complex acid labile subunit [Eumeta japonica]